ncbi:MAG TPA: response regulator transcription factor [Thermoleophilaceae bacterium]|nr:response regulator transcription factor [Thermoleophilaceae bacterium]
MEIRVLLVDDFPLVRGGIAAALETDPAIRVIGQAATAVEAIERVAELEPDVVLLDLGLPDGGVDTIGRLAEQAPASRILVITASENVELLSAAMAAGALGYLTKRATARELCDAVITIHGGGTVIDADLAAQFFRASTRRGGAEIRPVLTDRERQVVFLVGEGLTDKEIAETLFVSPRTVQNQLMSVRRKTGLGRRSELARWAATHLG